MIDDEDSNGIVASFSDAVVFAKGNGSRARIMVGPDVKAIRKEINLTKPEFAKTYRVPAGTLRDWEQRHRSPDTGFATLLNMIQADPKRVEKIIAKVR